MNSPIPDKLTPDRGASLLEQRANPTQPTQ